MQKNAKIAGIVIAIVALLAAGYYFYAAKEKDSKTESSIETGSMESDSKNPFSSIVDAMNRSQSLECKYTDADGRVTTAYVKGKSVRTSYSTNNKTDPNNFLILNDQMYTWNDSTKKGFTLKFDPTAQTNQNDNSNLDKASNTDVVGQLEQYKDDCKVSNVPDSEFEKPAGVTFQDFSSIYPSGQ